MHLKELSVVICPPLKLLWLQSFIRSFVIMTSKSVIMTSKRIDHQTTDISGILSPCKMLRTKGHLKELTI